MDEESLFRYFATPHHFSTYTDAPRLCPVCHVERAGYVAPFFGGDLAFICEDCLRGGALIALRQYTNTGDRVRLARQMHERHPALTESASADIVQRRTQELEQITPHLPTIQDFIWPCHCGDFVAFQKEIGRADLAILAQGGDEQAFIRDHLDEDLRDLADVSEWYSAIRPDAPQDNTTSHELGVYLFRCLDCQQDIITWDCM